MDPPTLSFADHRLPTLVREKQSNSANGAFGRHELHDSLEISGSRADPLRQFFADDIVPPIADYLATVGSREKRATAPVPAA